MCQHICAAMGGNLLDDYELGQQIRLALASHKRKYDRVGSVLPPVSDWIIKAHRGTIRQLISASIDIFAYCPRCGVKLNHRKYRLYSKVASAFEVATS